MTVVNKFNVNKQQVTLDADIIENMSANDVSYNSSLQYDENTVGDKLSELEKEVIFDVTKNNNGVTFASLSKLLSSENLSTLIPDSVRCGGMSIRFVQSSDNKYVQFRLKLATFDNNQFKLISNWESENAINELVAGSSDLSTSSAVYNAPQLFEETQLASTMTEFTGEETKSKYLVYKLDNIVVHKGETLKIQVSGIGSVIQYFTYSLNTKTDITTGSDVAIVASSKISRIDVTVNANRVLSSGTVSCVVSKVPYIAKDHEDTEYLMSEDSLDNQGVSFIPVTDISWTDAKYIDESGFPANDSIHSYSSPIAVKANDYFRGTLGYYDNVIALAWVVDAGKAYNMLMRATEVVGKPTPVNGQVYPFRVKIPKDGYISIVTLTSGKNVDFIIERGQGEKTNGNVENTIGLTSNFELVKVDTVNLFEPKECINNKWVNSSGNIESYGEYWASGFVPVDSDYIRMNYAPRRVSIYDNNFTLKEVIDNANSNFIFNINKTAHPKRTYIRFSIQKKKLSYEEREKLIVVNSVDNSDITASSIINTDFINSKPRGYVTLNDIKQYGADIVKGSYVSATVFNDDNGDAVTLDSSKIYLDRTSNNMYRYNGSALYYICYWDNKSVPFTSNFTLYIARNEESQQNMIVTANARYFRGNSVTAVPTIQFTPRCGTTLAGYLRRTIKYTIGNEYGFIKREWRPYPLNKIQDRTQIDVVVPAGVTLFIDTFGNYYSDKKVVGSYPILNCRQTNAFGQTLDAFEMIIRTGYDHIIAIPKRCADGTWVVFHDDGTINQSSPIIINNDNGTQITDNFKKMIECTYDELLGYDMGSLQSNFANLAYAGQKVPLLEDFLMMCAKTGVHPVFSVHPNWTSEEWAEIKALTDKWGVTKNLGLKSGDLSNLLNTAYSVFGDNIESYYHDVNNDTAISTHISNVKTAISTYDVDTSKVEVGIELFYSYASDANITSVRESGLPCAVVASETSITSEDYLHWIGLGVSQFTDSFNPSVGLNW